MRSTARASTRSRSRCSQVEWARRSLPPSSTASLARIRDFLGGLARDAGAPDPDDLARKWHILMKGSIISAGEGDADAARRAQASGRLLLDAELPAGAPPQRGSS